VAVPPRTRSSAPPPDWELVYKRNPVERIKRDKSPLGILDELPALIAAGYEQVPEEDLVRLKWWGLYHDKPKVGTFMLRIKLPGGRDAQTPAAVISAGTRPDQEVAVAPLAVIGEAAAGLPSPALIVVGDVVALSERLGADRGTLAIA